MGTFCVTTRQGALKGDDVLFWETKVQEKYRQTMQLEGINTVITKETPPVALIQTVRLPDLNHNQWSSCGNYFLMGKYGDESTGNQYHVFNALGIRLEEKYDNSISKTIFRPQNSTLIMEEDYATVKANFEKYHSRFAMLDEEAESKAKGEAANLKKNQWRSWCLFMQQGLE